MSETLNTIYICLCLCLVFEYLLLKAVLPESELRMNTCLTLLGKKIISYEKKSKHIKL